MLGGHFIWIDNRGWTIDYNACFLLLDTLQHHHPYPSPSPRLSSSYPSPLLSLLSPYLIYDHPYLIYDHVQWLNQLPEPLLGYEHYDAILSCQEISDINHRTR